MRSTDRPINQTHILMGPGSIWSTSTNTYFGASNKHHIYRSHCVRSKNANAVPLISVPKSQNIEMWQSDVVLWMDDGLLSDSNRHIAFDRTPNRFYLSSMMAKWQVFEIFRRIPDCRLCVSIWWNIPKAFLDVDDDGLCVRKHVACL